MPSWMQWSRPKRVLMPSGAKTAVYAQCWCRVQKVKLGKFQSVWTLIITSGLSKMADPPDLMNPWSCRVPQVWLYSCILVIRTSGGRLQFVILLEAWPWSAGCRIWHVLKYLEFFSAARVLFSFSFFFIFLQPVRSAGAWYFSTSHMRNPADRARPFCLL